MPDEGISKGALQHVGLARGLSLQCVVGPEREGRRERVGLNRSASYAVQDDAAT